MKVRFLIELSHVLNYLIVHRNEWKARAPKEQLTPLRTPVPFVVIHHSPIADACHNREECGAVMRRMQDIFMDQLGFKDIGYHFVIGSDGDAYEGCGWKAIGYHALHFNAVSLGLTLIGDWRNATPPAQQLNTLKALITAGVELSYIRPDYKIVGHHQVSNIECPGQALLDIIRSWAHYSPFPSSYKDLMNVREIPDVVKQLIANRTTVEPSILYQKQPATQKVF